MLGVLCFALSCRLCTADVDGAVETITYTQCLKEDGTMEADITVSKQHDGQYIVIATDTAHRHVETLLKRNLDPEGNKHVTVTGNNTFAPPKVRLSILRN